MWDIEDFTGTLYTQFETELGHLLQSCYWIDNRQWDEMHSIIPWEYHNIINLVKHDMKQWDKFYHLELSPIVNEFENYCTVLHSYDDRNSYQKAWSFMHIWDLELHDAAVTYTYKAAHSQGTEAEIFATIACDLWQYSRQLRIDANRPGCQATITEIIYPNLK